MRRIVVFTALSLMLAAGPASAAPTLEERYKSAVKLENAGSVVDALAMFESIPPEQRDFNTRLHIASCKRKLGRMLEAAKDYVAIRDDKTADQPTKDTAQSDLDAVVAATPIIRVTLAENAKGVSVFIDGAASSTPIERAVDPGSHTIVGKRGAVSVFERKVDVTEGTKVDVLVDAPTATVASEPVAPRPIAAEEPHRNLAPTFVAAGIGVVGVAVGTWALLRIPALERERDELALQGDRAADDRADAARTSQTIARIGFGVGLVGVGTAAVLYLTSSPRKDTASVRISPTVAGTWGLSLNGVW